MNFLIITSLFACVIASSVDIQCEYDYYEYKRTDELYACLVENDLQIFSPDIKINEISGSHMSEKSNNQINGLTIENKKIEYFPTNLGEKFMNLIALRIKFGRLKEVHQDDIKMFTNLKHLNLDENDIEALDDDLFEFNTKLLLVWFGKNKIKSIGRTTFDKLTKMDDFDLLGNICADDRVSHSNVRPAIIRIKEKCFKPDIELGHYKIRYQKLKNGNSKLNEGIETVKTENSKLTTQLKNMTEHNLKLSNDLNAKSEELNKKILEKDAEIQTLKSINNDLIKQFPKNEQNTQENQQTEQTIIKLEAQIKVHKNIISKQAEELNHKAKEAVENLKIIESLKNITSQLKRQLQDKDRELQELSIENSNLNLNADKIKDKNKQLEDQLHFISYQINGTSNENDKILKDLKNKINEKNSLEYQLKSSQTMERNLTEGIKQCENKNNRLKNQLNEIQTRSAFHQVNLTEVINNLKDNAHNLEIKNIQLENKIVNLEEKLQKETTKVHDTLVTNNRYVGQLQECKKNGSFLERQLHGARADIRKIQRDLKLEKTNSAQCDNRLQNIQKNLTERIDRFENINRNLSAELNQERVRVNNSKTENNNLQIQVANLNEIINQLEDNIKNSMINSNNLQKNLSDCILAYDLTLKQLNSSEVNVQNLNIQLKDNEENSTNRIQNLNKENTNINAELANFKNKSSQLEQKVIEKNKNINELTRSKDKTLNDLRELQDKHNQFQLQSNQKILEMSRLNNQTMKELKESQSTNQQIKDQLRKTTELSLSLQTSNDQKSRKIQDLQGAINNLNFNLQDSRNYSKLLEANFSSTLQNITERHNIEAEEYQAKINNFTYVSEQLRQDIRDNKVTIELKESENRNFENQVFILNQGLNESIAMTDDLNIQLNDTIIKLENLKIIKTKIEELNQYLNKEVEIVNADYLKCESLPTYTWDSHPIIFASIPLMCILSVVDLYASFRCFR